MPVSNQLRLLLWKDYLMRKRKPITLAGIFWAIGVVASICIVRFNIDNQDFPTCQFAARALPSAGLLTFLQSFICNVNNECNPMDQFEEIPTYEKSKLTEIQRQMSPLVNNETIIDVAASIPDALKLISTLSAVADEPAFLDLAKNGIHVKDMLRSRNKVQRYLKDQLALPDDVVNDIIEARIGFEGVQRNFYEEDDYYRR
ncbi:retinal-specific phospholipid-transporting ATPase ABCA4-like [Leptidea sinapis]|uniref:retinal-specific phospholipid-transporting ATPase ABCA4-like n=1 Tax=Leptidea sinapis TaxID=189913 RepID=UPI0021C2BB5F|nr:retinal-specific phospholipid-transporting ATPase ABCA4-like [Leptidea sinapis]